MPIILGSVFQENSGQENHMIIKSDYYLDVQVSVIVFRTAPFQSVFHAKRQSRSFQIPPLLKSIFEKLRFLVRLVWMVGVTAAIKLGNSEFSPIHGRTCLKWYGYAVSAFFSPPMTRFRL